MHTKPIFEAIKSDFGHSFTNKQFNDLNINENNAWHYHPEIELVYVHGGAGKRQIGSHVSYYTNGSLILVGSNLPHCSFTDKFTGNKRETVIQMKPNFLANSFFKAPEIKKIKTLLEIAKGGIVFYGETKKLLKKNEVHWLTIRF